MHQATAWRTGLWLGASIVAIAGTAPAIAVTFNVGGGTISTTDTNDTALDETTSHNYGFTLTQGSNAATDTVVISNVTINDQANGSSFPFPHTFDAIFVQGTATGSLSVIMHGSNLTALDDAGLTVEGTNGSALDTTGGPANRVTSYIVQSVAATVVKLGPDTINTGATGDEGIVATGNSAAVDISGGGITAPNGGIFVSGGVVGGNGVGGSGAVVIGGQNGGIQASISAMNGYGIDAGNIGSGPVSVTLGKNGTINGKGGILVHSFAALPLTVDVFGNITAVGNPAINSVFGGSPTRLALTLENGSATNGLVQYSSDGTNSITIFDGANITNTTFAGSGFNSGSTIFDLRGTNSATFNFGIVSGITALQKDDSGIWTLAGTGTYSGVTTVNAGTLNVTGSIASSAVSVANGGTLTGTGTVGAVTVASGGTLSPGAGGAPGTLTAQGNLTLASGATYVDAISPTVTGLTNVSGTAAVNGALAVNAASGTYTVGQHYTLLSAAGGLSGTFSSVSTTGLNAYKTAIGYDANSVFLTLSANAIAPLLPAGVGGNAIGAAKSIDAAIAGGATLNSGFNTLFGLSGAALGSAMSQISGEAGADAAQAGSQAFLPFVSTLMAEGVDGSATVTAANFAPGNAYGENGAPRPAQLATGATRIWGSVYGRHTGIAADPVAGTQSLKAGDAGFAAGIEMQVSDHLRLGAAAGGGHGSFRAGNGQGASNDAMLGVYGDLAVADQGYVAGAFSYGWHDVDTLRLLTISGTDLLSAKYTAHDVGARIEGGWRVMLDERDVLVPYAAFVWDDFQAPGYGERAASGSANFALSYAAHDSDFGHSELGLKAGRSIAAGGGVMALELSAAWAHELYGAPFALATFQALPGSSFAVQGGRIAGDTALLGAGLDWTGGSGLTFGARMDSQLGGGTTAIAGTGTIALRW